MVGVDVEVFSVDVFSFAVDELSLVPVDDEPLSLLALLDALDDPELVALFLASFL